ncbi:Uncharacterised protein [uncultured archaeon]|nr:Uncharacterised protein [uncultured archaeon]
MKSGKKQSSKVVWALYIALALLIVAYALSGSSVFGFAALLLIAGIFYYEISHSVRNEGAVRSVIDVATAIGAAIVVWILLMVILQTSAPVDAVSSCSMLPVLQRGDLVALHGIGNVTKFLISQHVPVINVDRTSFQRMQANMSSEFLAFYAYQTTNKSRIAYIFDSNSSGYGIGLYSTPCLSRLSYLGQRGKFYTCYVQPSQDGNLVKYNYSVGNVSISGSNSRIVYTSGITVGGTTVAENYSGPIVVYQTTKSDYFSGSIIHRVVAAMNVSGTYYFLTKGDNNQALDIQFENYPVNSTAVLGYVIADIPLAGYVKLILSGQLAVPAGCNQTILR